nr:hypothetical protein [Tanacetum cinerariifolium]
MIMGMESQQGKTIGSESGAFECVSDLSFCKEEECPLHENQENQGMS